MIEEPSCCRSHANAKVLADHFAQTTYQLLAPIMDDRDILEVYLLAMEIAKARLLTGPLHATQTGGTN